VGVPGLTLGACHAQVSPDERSAVAYELMTLSVARMLKLLYPLLYRVDVLPAQVRSPYSAPPRGTAGGRRSPGSTNQRLGPQMRRWHRPPTASDTAAGCVLPSWPPCLVSQSASTLGGASIQLKWVLECSSKAGWAAPCSAW
jgi:hypothetical protein